MKKKVQSINLRGIFAVKMKCLVLLIDEFNFILIILTKLLQQNNKNEFYK